MEPGPKDEGAETPESPEAPAADAPEASDASETSQTPIPVDPASTVAAGGPPRDRSRGYGVAFLLAASALVAAIITARASVVGGEATGLWQQSVREEQRRGGLLVQGVRFTYGDVGDTAFMIATSQVRADALREAAASAPPEVAAALTAEAAVHSQVADAMRTSISLADDPRFQLPSGGYDLQASLANDRVEGETVDLADPLATIAAADAASVQTIRILSVAIVVALGFLAGSLAQALPSRRRLLLFVGWVTLGIAVLLSVFVELTG